MRTGREYNPACALWELTKYKYATGVGLNINRTGRDNIGEPEPHAAVRAAPIPRGGIATLGRAQYALPPAPGWLLQPRPHTTLGLLSRERGAEDPYHHHALSISLSRRSARTAYSRHRQGCPESGAPRHRLAEHSSRSPCEHRPSGVQLAPTLEGLGVSSVHRAVFGCGSGLLPSCVPGNPRNARPNTLRPPRALVHLELAPLAAVRRRGVDCSGKLPVGFRVIADSPGGAGRALTRARCEARRHRAVRPHHLHQVSNRSPTKCTTPLHHHLH